VSTPQSRTPALATTTCVVVDDFLSESDCDAVGDWATRTNYRRVNAHGAIDRSWDIASGSPLRSTEDFYSLAAGAPALERAIVYPTGRPVDRFIAAVDATVAAMAPTVGPAGPDGWREYSVTAWIYPPGTGLGLHADGAGVYTGAYVYFLCRQWRPHWGGLLLVMDPGSNVAIDRRRRETGELAVYERHWLHASGVDEAAMENGLARCILPKRNRIVFIAPDAYHMVTQVLPECGDTPRMSLGGFFRRGAWPQPAPGRTGEDRKG
jgi:Rps23 Pro-64 3,4-dihydroxylase Tpa1-like proline 4-hydroxylase